jgi:hypothetical protein
LNSISESEIEIFCKNISNIRSVQTPSSLPQADAVPDPQIVSEYLSEPYADPLQVSPFITLLGLLFPSQTPLLYFVALRACDEFHALYQRYPGEPLRRADEDEAAPFEFGSEEDLHQVSLGSSPSLSLSHLLSLCASLCIALSLSLSLQIGEDGKVVWTLLQSLAQRYGIPIKEKKEEDDAMTDECDNAELMESATLTMAHAQEMTRYGGIELHNISSFMGGIAAQEAVKIITHLYVPLPGLFVFNGIAGCGGTYNI